VFAVRQNLCRAFFVGRTAKNCVICRAHGKELSLPCARQKTHGKDLVCRAFFSNARQSIFLPLRPPHKPSIILSKIHTLLCASISAHGKPMCLSCVFVLAHSKVFFNYFP
jgi:hypothetical protein